jgi:hypothetical protein
MFLVKKLPSVSRPRALTGSGEETSGRRGAPCHGHDLAAVTNGQRARSRRFATRFDGDRRPRDVATIMEGT